jgi:glycosyltransferase involved in cell wall biosynthesis
MDIVIDGENGFVVKTRNKKLFADCMIKAISLPRPVNNDNVLRYSTHRLKDDLLSHWQLL